MLSKFLQFCFESFDFVANETTIHLKLRFTRTATHANAATLAFEVGPATNEPRHQVLHLGQFDLQLALRATCTLGKDVQNQISPINHAHANDFFNVANLDRRELVVKHDQIGVMLRNTCRNLFDFPTACKCSGVRFCAFAADRRRDCRARALDQFHRLRQTVFEQSIVKIHADDDRLRTAKRVPRHVRSRFFGEFRLHLVEVHRIAQDHSAR